VPESSTAQPGKIVRVNLPQALIVQMERAAKAEHITLDELVRDAMEHRLNRRGLDEVFAFGNGTRKSAG